MECSAGELSPEPGCGCFIQQVDLCALCVLACASEVEDDYGARGFGLSQCPKRKSKELMLLGKSGGRISRNVLLPNPF